MKARLFGLFCLLIALGAAWWSIWEPLQAAAEQTGRVRYRLAGFVLVPAAVVFGLFFLIFGDSVPYRNAERQSPTAAGWALLVLMAAGSGATFWWFKDKMTGLGYAYSGSTPVAPATPTPMPAGVPPHVEQPAFGTGR
jgi:hypothetical protein